MSTVCHAFVQNAWRKDICSNCFRVRDEHSTRDNDNSVKLNISSSTTPSSTKTQNPVPAIIPRKSINKKYGIDGPPNVILIQGADQNFSQKVSRFEGGSQSSTLPGLISSNNNSSHNNAILSSSTTSLYGQQGLGNCSVKSSNTIPTTTVGNGKFSGTNESCTENNGNGGNTTSKGFYSGVSGSKSNINICGNFSSNNPQHKNHNDNSSTSHETNGKTWSPEEGVKLASSSSHLHSNQPQAVMQQGKGVMTNQHPSKSDNSGVTSNQNNNDNNNIPTSKQFTSSLPPGAVSHLSSTSTGRNSAQSSSYITSKNIFNNVHVTTTASNVGSSGTPNYSTASTARSTTSSASNNCTSTTGLAGCINGSAAEVSSTLISSPSSSTGLSHPQSSDSIKRGNNAVSVSSASSLIAPSTSVSSSETIISDSGTGGTIVDIVVSCNNGGVSGASHQNKNLENCDQTGVEIPSFGEGNQSKSGVSGGAARGVQLSTQSVLPKSRSLKQVHSGTDGDSVLDRRKVGISGVDSSTHVNGCSGQVMSSNGIHGKPIPAARSVSKGILRGKNGNKKREKNVRFPDEVVSVIGYSDSPSGLSHYDDDDSPPDPLDSASVNEVMEKNSTTSEEKELHRVTQKNTNFNSIKTNLLGTTCIEIGPIVGCTGGKSMEGSSKPLVSIGTFETRKEPLRIRKKISEDSADDELNEKTVEKHRKFISKSSVGSASEGVRPPLPTSQAPTKIASLSSNSSQSSATKVLSESGKQQVTTVSASKGVISSNSKTTLSSSSSTTINSISSKATVSSGKLASSNTTKGATSSLLTEGNGSTTITINPEKPSPPVAVSANDTKEKFTDKSVKSKTSNIPCSNAASRGLQSSNITINAASSATKVNKWGSNNMTSSDGSALRNKPVLKRIHQKNFPETETYTANTAIVEINNGSASTMNESANSTTNGRSSNLIILTNGDKNKASGASIASKRSSFLRDIVDSNGGSASGSGASVTIDGTPAGDEIDGNNGTSAASEGVHVICSGNNGSGPVSTHEQDALLKSELKVDIKPSVNNGKLSHPPFAECLSNRSNGTDDSSEFDDSLEDSGLDIKKCSEISESDEKSGSGSDSGNENDYSDRDRVKMIPVAGPKGGLYISVEDVEGTSKKPEKLSPDSVLFSSASEMSASGSSESIPEALDTISNGSSQNNNVSTKSASTTVQVDGGSGVNTSKRAAPRPPSSTNVNTDAGSTGVYANTHSTPASSEGLYDDVSFYKNPMHFPIDKDANKAVEEDNDDDENIYDDCTAIMDDSNKSKATGKIAGSYNFQNESALDSDGDEDIEKVVQRRPDGIEFIGIRKIDSESFLRERSPTPDRFPDSNRERSSSASPKTRRKVNQFFSTIGKKAGAAFSHHVQAYKNKSNPIIEDSAIEKSPSGNSSAYKRSLSTDEVSMARTQVYATLTPTSMKFKGLGPVLHRLSKIDINMSDKEKGASEEEDGKEKKKHKISSSIKKFLRFGSKDGESGHKYDFGNCQTKTETNGLSRMAAQGSQDGLSDHSSSRTPSPTKAVTMTGQLKISAAKPYGTVAARPPPPPPPRIHSLDLLNRVGVVPHGTVRPARPPPPTRQNRVAPSFTQVFANHGADSEAKANGTGPDIPSKQPMAHLHPENPDPNNPPSKPKRKASMNLDCVTNGASRDLETTYNHITTLNLETLKLIASQTPLKIRRSTNLKRRAISHLKWSHFQLSDPSKPLTQGQGFAFYSALLDDESCVLLVQETTTAPNFTAPFEFPCVETSSTFEDNIPLSFVTWKASEYATNGSSVKAFVSVMPKFSMHTVDDYMRHSQVPLLHKYFALLQAMSFWDKEDMSDLLVLVQSMEDSDNFHTTTRGSSSDTVCQPLSPSSVLVYVHPIPHLPSGNGRSSSRTMLTTDFENAMKQLLLNNGQDGSTPLLGDNDRHVLMKRLSANRNKTVQEQFRLFLQVKLFAPKRDSGEMERIKTLRTERAIQQWLDRERALCMKEAIEQTLQRNIESSISPYKRSYLEFLLTPENSAKAVLEMVIDLLE